MKILKNILIVSLGIFLFQNCDKDSKLHPDNQQVENAFTEKYPGATRVGWEKKGDYSVVDFTYKGEKNEAWFDQTGVWYMTETDILFEALPDAVKKAFLASQYKTWHIEDVDKIDRKGMETVYVIEIESGKQEHDLYYSPAGVLIKDVKDTDHNDDDNQHYLPPTMGDAVTTYIKKHYPQAKILEMDREKGKIEVDILDGKVHRELSFKADTGEWLSTQTEIRLNEVPANIMNVLKASEYSGYEIEDVDYYETPLSKYYLFELERNDREVHVKITTEGKLEVVKVENDK